MGFPGVKAVIFDLDDTLTVHQAAYDDSYLVIAMEIARRHDIDPTAAASSMPAIFLRAGEKTPQSRFLRRIGIGGRDLLWGDAGADRPELADISTWLNDFRVSSWSSVLQTHGICDHRSLPGWLGSSLTKCGAASDHSRRSEPSCVPWLTGSNWESSRTGCHLTNTANWPRAVYPTSSKPRSRRAVLEWESPTQRHSTLCSKSWAYHHTRR